jgi:hypothetical protein
LTYVLDWDDDMDETMTLSGSNKVGDWTASGEVFYALGTRGCSNHSYAYAINPVDSDNDTVGNSDNGTVTSHHHGAEACATTQTGADSSAITLTDGTMTIVFGDASHLSGQNVSSGSAAAGAITMDGADEDVSAGAFVGGFHGVSVGYKINEAMSVTGAFQKSSDVSDQMGAGEALDGETTASHGTTGFGVSFSGDFGPAKIGVTQASAATADVTGAAAAALLSTKMSTMGLGVKLTFGDISPWISYGTYTGSAGSTANASKEHTHTASELGLTYALGSDKIIVYVGNSEDKYSTSDKATTKSGMEVGYNTTVGPATLKVGYGTQTKADADKTDGCGGADGVTGFDEDSCDGYSMSDIEVALSFSF